MNIWGNILVAQYNTNHRHGNCVPEKYGKMMCCLSDFLFNLGHVMLYESWLLETCLLLFTGRHTTVPPKGTPSVRSLEPLICLWEVLVIAGPPHPPKEKYSLTADIAVL